MNKNSFIHIPEPKPQAKTRVICFPYAGGGLGTYLPWKDYLHNDIELAIVQMPGRGARFLEQPVKCMSELSEKILQSIESLFDRPVIFFGHSLGASVAYEVIRRLHVKGRALPHFFIASSRKAPTITSLKPPIHDLDDVSFKLKLRELGGTPSELLDNEELMSMLMPCLRADFKIAETYQNKDESIIPSTIMVLRGSNDKVSIDECEPWLSLFSANKGLHDFDGGHFFIDAKPRDISNKINSLLSEMFTPFYEDQKRCSLV